LGETQFSLAAGENRLTATLQTTDEEQLTRMEAVVADHLQRMSADETFNFAWQR
jgi:hypothetical protein